MKLLTTFFGVMALVPLMAQEPAAAPAKEALPPGPLLNNAPDFATWTIDFKAEGEESTAQSATTGGGKQPPNPNDQRVTVVKTGAIRVKQVAAATGLTLQTWDSGNYEITVSGTGGIPAVTILPAGSGSKKVSDFPEFQWVSRSNFRSVGIVGGVKCLIFKATVGEDQVDSVACINFDTRLPVYLKSADVIQSYRFGPAPQEPLVLPPNIQEAIASVTRRLQQASAPSVAP